MSIKATLSSDGLEEVYSPSTLKEICLYKCLTNKAILTTEVEVDEDMDGSQSNKLDWEKYRLKEPIQKDLVEALLNAGEKFLFALTPKYEPVFGAIRMSQPEHLAKVHVSNTHTLEDRQLELLISGGNVKSLDIHGCIKLNRRSIYAINKFGNKLEYLRIGGCRCLAYAIACAGNSAILRTPNLKTFIVGEIHSDSPNVTNYWKRLLQDFISNLEDLQINRSGKFQSLDFLEPARNKLSSLSFRNCEVTQNANAWASLFKLEKLRFLDVVGSSIGEAFQGENVVQRLLTAMPNLRSLAVDPGLVKNIYVDTSIRVQGSVLKRLEFLAIMDNDKDRTDETEVRKVKLLANDVAYYGSVEGGLRVLEYFSNLLNASCFDSTLELLLIGLSDVAPRNTVTVIGLLMKIFKNHGVEHLHSYSLFQQLKKLFTPDVATKLGTVLVHQCIAAIVVCLSRWSVEDESDAEPYVIGVLIDILMNLDGELRFDHYITIVPSAMLIAKADIAMTKSIYVEGMDDVGIRIGMHAFKDLLEKIARLLKQAVDRFPGETNELWGISSVLVIIKDLKDLMVSHEIYRVDLMEGFSSLITSLRKLCLNSGPRRAAFHSANGVGIVMDLLKEILDGCLGLADRDSLALLAILKSILEDTNLELSESGMISSGLEKCFLTVNSQWEFGKSPHSDRGTTHYFQLEGIAKLLNFMESDPRYDYNASATVKEIVIKLK